jgi:hypothetical protein
MPTQTIRILIAGALFVHGIGHTLGFWKPAKSIPFVKMTKNGEKLVAGILWLLIALGFTLSALGFLGIIIPSSWWRPVAIISSVISLGGLTLFGRSWPIFNFIGASAMNIIVLISLLWLDWPPIQIFGR